MKVMRINIVAILCLNLGGYLYGAHQSNYSKWRSVVDGANSTISGEKTINCFHCENYLKAACNHVELTTNERNNKIKKSLDEAGQFVLVDAPFFSLAAHEAEFNATKITDLRIPICSKCIGILPDYEGDDDYKVCLTKLASATGMHGTNMARTSHQGHSFGCVNQGSTPLWSDVFATMDGKKSDGLATNFVEFGSGFNLKPLAVWLLGQGKFNCTVNDINSQNCINFIKSYFFLDPREIKDAHKKSFITLDISDITSGNFSKKSQKYDVVVITNVFHYFTAEQIAKAMKELVAITKKDSLVYLQAFSGTDENDVINPFLVRLLDINRLDEPIYLQNGHEQISAYVKQSFNMDAETADQLLDGKDKLPNIASQIAKPFAFFPRASLEKLGRDYGFHVVKSGQFDLETPSGGTHVPIKTPYFSWVKLKKL